MPLYEVVVTNILLLLGYCKTIAETLQATEKEKETAENLAHVMLDFSGHGIKSLWRK